MQGTRTVSPAPAGRAESGRTTPRVAPGRKADAERPARSAGPSLTHTEQVTATPPGGLGWSCPRPITFRRVTRNPRTGAQLGAPELVDRPCKRKSCPGCGPVMRRQFIAHYLDALKDYPDLRYVTLTCDPKTGMAAGDTEPALSADDSRGYLTWAWQKFRKRLARRGLNAFLATWERHKSGYWHIHALLSVDLGADDLRTQASQSGFGAVMDVQLLRDSEDADEREALARTLGYILAYITKAEGTGSRGLMVSEGDGFYSRLARAARDAWAAENVPGHKPAAVRLSDYFDMVGRAERTGRPVTLLEAPERRPSPANPWPAPSPDQRRRFRQLTRERCTLTYREHAKDGSVQVHHYTPRGEYLGAELHRDVQWPGAWRRQKPVPNPTRN